MPVIISGKEEQVMLLLLLFFNGITLMCRGVSSDTGEGQRSHPMTTFLFQREKVRVF